MLLLLVGTLEAIVQNSAAWLTNEQQEQIVERLRSVLPPGWTITQTAMNRTPDDWYTLDNRGFEIDGKNGEHVFQLWFLPKDWLGIRQTRPNRLRLVYWEGVLVGQDFKTITNTDQAPVQEALQRLSMSTPSLVNGGWHLAEIVFKDRLPQVDSQTQALVSRYCKDKPCRDEAAYSLIVLGVPAHSITLDCAEHAMGKAQEFCVSALGYWKGSQSVRVLNDVVSNPASSSRVQKYAAIALEWIADPSSGPALLKSLRTISFSEAAAQVAEALGRIHYELAAPEILARMAREPHDAFRQAQYAKALASLRYKPAVPAIEQLCKTTTFSADWILQQQRDTYIGWLPEIALMRLIAPWGRPANGIRLLLLPPESSALPGPIRVAAAIENEGDRDLDILGTPGDVIVDGKTYDHTDPVMMDGNYTLRVNDVDVHAIDLSGLIANPGLHRIEYRRGTTTSNQLTLQIPIVKP